MVRRRRNQGDARHRMAQLADVFGHLVPGNWPPSPGLAPWAILIWIWSALTRYSVVTPKRPEANLLDGGTQGIAILEGVVTPRCARNRRFPTGLAGLQRG